MFGRLPAPFSVTADLCGSSRWDFRTDTIFALRMTGFVSATGKITDVDGAIMLVNRDETIAALRLQRHHGAMELQTCQGGLCALPDARPAPKLRLQSHRPDERRDRRAAPAGGLCQRAVYYDQGIKMDRADTDKPVTKGRSLFRVKHCGLEALYRSSEVVDLLV